MNVWMYECMNAWTYVRTYVCMYVSMYLCIYVCMFVSIVLSYYCIIVLLLLSQKMTWGGWVSPFCKAKSDFWRPRPLQNEEPATNLARGFLYKIRAPNPLFLVHFCDFQNHWPLQSGEPDMSKHLSRIATWKKENHQKYKDPFCRGMMWKNLGLPVSPENPETTKKIFCRGNSCSTFPVFVKSI